jgi:DNA-directed RNA polymerase delta subunit
MPSCLFDLSDREESEDEIEYEEQDEEEGKSSLDDYVKDEDEDPDEEINECYLEEEDSLFPSLWDKR